MATAVAIAIRKEAVLDRLTSSLTGLNSVAGTDIAERPTQIHPDLREVVLLEWIADAVEHVPGAVKASTDALTKERDGLQAVANSLNHQLNDTTAILTSDQKKALLDAATAKEESDAKAKKGK